MRINDDHMYHGAALTQIAEHPQFTAINSFTIDHKPSRSAFRINDDIGVYIKYATSPTTSYSEYVFNFRREHLKELDQLEQKTKKVFAALVCVRDKDICCMSYAELKGIIDSRDPDALFRENHYSILVTLERRKRFRAYISPKGKKKQKRGERTIPRNQFPKIIFD